MTPNQWTIELLTSIAESMESIDARLAIAYPLPGERDAQARALIESAFAGSDKT